VDSFLSSHFIRDVKRTKELIKLSPNDSVETALQTLATKKITAAAIYDPVGQSFLGFVDALDLSVFIVRVFAENYQNHPHLYDPKELERRFQLPVREVINASKRDVFHPVEITETLAFLVTNFLQFGVHRVPILEDGQVVGIVTQSDVIKYLYTHSAKLAYCAKEIVRGAYGQRKCNFDNK